MAIMLDTGNLESIKRYHRMGVIRGVTTNPTILLKEGVTGGIEAIKSRLIEIAEFITPYPLSVELTTNDPAEMIPQAEEFAAWASNVVVKVTIHGPEGETENLEIIHELSKKNVKTNVTAMMSSQQCLLAAMAGADYVSLFCGRVNNMGYDSRKEVASLRSLLDRFELKAQIIAASTREVINIVEWLYAGAHFVTVLPDFLETMIVHPYSKETVQMFLNDARKAETQIR